ncbi:MAG: 30S ribosomal protein S5 [Vigna little leaf phytoplasma]|nr:30S ribosomal protein S5 [Vigna little leaf phytoplasma]MDV3198128.1 30S ribosomal protein S5 [Vigna little leaf phytoplasma]
MINDKKFSLFEIVININRIVKVVKGGRRFRFSALVVVGDKKGKVGFATGKALEISDAIKKALEKAKKRLINIPLVGSTIPHEVVGIFGASKAFLKPTSKGRGIIAGGKAARAIFELAGINDISSKTFGSRTPINVLKAVMEGLKQLRSLKYIENLRGVSLDNIYKGVIIR